MYSVGVVGRNTDLAVDKGFERRIISDPWRSVHDLCRIDCLKESHTYRRIEFRSGTLQLKYIGSLKVWFWNLMFGTHGNTDTPRQMTRYPQRHTVDFTIVGANGPQGFLPASNNASFSGNWGDNRHNIPIGIAGMMRIYARYGKWWDAQSGTIGTNPQTWIEYGQGSDPNRWQIHEQTGWTNSVYESSSELNAGFSLAEDNYGPIFTRPTTFSAMRRLGSDYMTLGHLRAARGMYLFYSPSNVVTFRIVFDIVNWDTRFLTIKRYTGGRSHS